MRTRTTLAAAALLAAGALLGGLAPGRLAPDVRAQDKPPGGDRPYNFERGFPTPETTQKARDEADYQRAITAYRFWYPTISCEGIFNGNREKGVNDNESIVILSAGPRHV